ncbi:ISL3 family transposase [Bifidobacterium pseudolongum]|uniref:ISL3 family transposase n=1 Tax=Bifidobacterium pseudolongum TaxID=1694 RepID=UPI002FD81A40
MNEETRPEPEFSVFDPQRFLGLDEMGLRVLSWRRLGGPDRPGLRQIRCEPDSHDARWCPSCGAYARVRSSWLRTLAHVPYGDDAVHLLVRVRRYECVPCSRSWSDDLEEAAAGRGVLSGPAVMWALRRVCLDSMTVSACARLLRVAWAVADRTVRDRGMPLLEQADRFSSVRAIGVDEHVWRHGAFGDRYVTAVVDLSPRADGRPARLLDMVPGRSARVLREWMHARGDEFTRRVGVVAMDAFAGWKQAVESVLPHAVEVIDPFHVVQLAAARVTKMRCRLQRDATGRRGVKDDRLYDCRRALLTSDEYPDARGRARPMALFAIQANRDPMLAHDAYQRVIHAYRCDDRRRGERMMRALIDDLNESPRYGGFRELTSLGRVLRRRMHDILALFRHHHSSNGPTEAINGRIETLRGNAMGFANTTSYIQRCLIHSSQLKDILTH